MHDAVVAPSLPPPTGRQATICNISSGASREAKSDTALPGDFNTVCAATEEDKQPGGCGFMAIPVTDVL